MRPLLPMHREQYWIDVPETPPYNSRTLLILFGWVLFAFFLELGLTEAAAREKQSVSTLVSMPCWLVEDFVVAEECAPCTTFQAKTTPECGTTGFVEKISCSVSKRDEFKRLFPCCLSCRSAMMERHLFWKFEGAVVGVAAVFACLVILRQRSLDRKALEKVRKQIESI
ncbi:protein JTB isoform X1 [Phascolarctos cinereus]|uniref:Protein JTB n=1 Tax=Phascolarctos cinereus TaxID=38626 RepID=A0A6P5KP17_PHACI|nr:protein JTB isoform X1 [Phascolarctos cinereus]XP_020847361.1 protein JTB isoform X1 [Phascolarctos cinereus]